jgi:hypothetical protein
MTISSTISFMTSFLSDQQQGTVVDCYLLLLAEDKIRRDARLQELTKSLERLPQEVNQQHRDIRQLQQALDEQAAWRTQAEADLARQDRLLAAYRVGAQDLDDKYALVDGLFQQALEWPLPAEAIDLYREIADAQQPDESTPVRQLRALSRFNIGVVLATQVNDPLAARKAYEQVLAEYGSDPDPLVQQLYRTAGEYRAGLEHTAAA